MLDGARHLTIAGHYVYVTTDDSLVVLDLDDPMNPKVTKVIEMEDPRATAVQFRYLFVTDTAGMWTFDITDMANPMPVPGAMVPLADGQQDLRRPHLRLCRRRRGGARHHQREAPDGAEAPGDVHRRRSDLGRTGRGGGNNDASLYAYVADGVNGLKVVHLTPGQAAAILRLQPGAEAGADRVVGDRMAGPVARRRASTGIARWMRPAARSPSWVASAPAVHQGGDGELYLDRERTPYFVSDEPVAADFRPGPPKRGRPPTRGPGTPRRTGRRRLTGLM